MKFLASIFLSIAAALDSRRNFSALKEEHARLSRHFDRLEKAHTELVITTYSDELDPRFDVAPEIGPEERAAFAAFLKTEAGQAVARRFAAVAMNQALVGCADAMHTTYAAGTGNGWNEAWKWFLTISRVSRVADTNDEPGLEGEDQLLERMSP